MRRRIGYILLPVILLVAIVSCGRKKESAGEFIPSFSTYRMQTPEETPIPPEKREIFYGLLTPIEVCNIFNRLGVPYDEASLNPVTNAANYMTSSKAALNLGVYGVDLGYLKIFRKNQDIFNYMLTVREMTGRLNIPESYLTEPIRRVEVDMDNPDSILVIMNRAYKMIEDHLRTDGRQSVVGLMLMGGWIEAMHLATSLTYDETNPDPEVVQKIAEQKYTLTSLLSLMKNYYDDPMIVFYTKKLLFLKRYFDTFEIYFRKGDLEIDTSRQALVSTGSEMTITVGTLNNIRDYVAKLRSEIVN
ncbi:MAG: hypothetical protein RBS37_03900 [Bacteroidales bacterium]|jgi:hypothetical protein|nr:hypothetical protein [Bacteroidales bacterium]